MPSGDAPPRLVALAAALCGRGRNSRTLAKRELGGVRDAIVVFDGEIGAGALWRARLAGNYTLLDVRGSAAGPRFPGAARLVNGAIFRNRRQQKDLDRPRWTSRVIYDEPEPGLVAAQRPGGRVSRRLLRRQRRRRAFRQAPRRGVHRQPSAAPRRTVQLPSGAVRPGTRRALPARRGGGERRRLRRGAGDDARRRGGRAPGRRPIRSTASAIAPRSRRRSSARAQPAADREWKAALALLREAGAKSTLERVVEQHLEHFAALERAVATA